MGRKAKGGGEGGGLPAWMGTYGDMVTLLLCFFVLLFAMSTVDSTKYKNAVYAMRGSFGVMKGGSTLNPADLVSSPKVSGQGSSFKYQSIAKKLKGEMEKYAGKEKEGEKASENKSEADKTGVSKKQEEKVEISINEKGIVISVAESFLFESGRANLKPEALPVLDVILDTIIQLPNNVAVEGHTDNVPIKTFQFPSNWELSGGRAAAVVRYFLNKNVEIEKRLSIAGYADTRPKAVNTSIEGRSKNRRVEIVILKTLEEQFEEKNAEVININNI
ncbi:MAG: OmpA family protein [Fusobacteriaceae bacterium]|nr:OmpA family protein [Fusobacteriaceae bacterium]MBN2839112.1 OmpA family protein [Fusobacteriaceae bacterium]